MARRPPQRRLRGAVRAARRAARIEADLGKAAAAFLKAHDDNALGTLMSDLGGHCMETLVEAFDAAQDDVPTLFMAWTVKGFGLPFAGHKDNHSGLMNPTQAHGLRDSMGDIRRRRVEAPRGHWRQCPSRRRSPTRTQPHQARQAQPQLRHHRNIPAIPAPQGETIDQAAFGRIMLDLSRAGGDLADRIVTTSPDVTVSTNLGAWVNQRGLFKRREMKDVFAAAKIASAQKWSATNQGQHIELGIAESNLFLMLAALGLAGDLFDHRLFPIGTLYDPFIARGLDSLNYACYQDARSSCRYPFGDHARAGRRRAPVDQPAADRARTTRSSPLRARLRRRTRGDDRGGIPPDRRPRRRIDYSASRPQPSPDRTRRRPLESGCLAGGYWLREPGDGAEAAIVAMGALMPEALAAWEELSADLPGLGLLAVTSPDLLHRGWSAAQAARQGRREPSHVERLLSRLAPEPGS